MPDTEELDEELSDEEIDMGEVEDMSLEEIQAESEPAEEDFGFESGVEKYQPVDVPIEELTANDWNPNEMASEEFNRLCENIEEDGFITAIQAVPVDEDGDNIEFEFDDDVSEQEKSEKMKEEMDHARIVGGEHRWSAAKVVGMTDIPTILVPNKDREWEKLATVRMNAISGDLDAIQFAELVEEQREKMEDDQLKHALGFAGEETLFDSVLEDVKESVPDDVSEELEDHEDELETIDDLSEILNRIFREHGDELDHNFITFSYGGEDNVMYQCNDDLWAKVVDINNRIEDLDVSATDFWQDLLGEAPVDEHLATNEGTAATGEPESHEDEDE